MHRLLLPLGLVFALALPTTALAGVTLDRVHAKGEVVDVLVNDYPPFGFINAKNELDDFDVARALAAKLGVKLKLETPGWETIIGGKWAGRWDIAISSATPTEERAKVVNFPAIYYNLPAVLVVNSALTSGVMALSLNYAAYLAETIRAGIASAPRGQGEAAAALGLSGVNAAWLIVAPQAMRIIIPPAGAQFVSMLKDSSLVSLMGLWELNFLAQSYGRSAYHYMEMLLTAAFIYWALSIVFELIQHRLELRFGRAYGSHRH